jgi:hypothetical protein
VTERKLGNTHLLEACEPISKYDGERAEKGGERRESDGKKDGNYAFSRSSPRLALNEREKGGKKIE